MISPAMKSFVVWFVAAVVIAVMLVSANGASGQTPHLYDQVAETCRAHGYAVAWHRDAPLGSVWKTSPLTLSVRLAPVPSYWQGVLVAEEMNAAAPGTYPCAPHCTVSDGVAVAVDRYHRSYLLRYGHAISDANGYLAEETYSDGAMWERMNAPGNPLSLACNPDCPFPIDNGEEEHDAKIVGNYSMVSCWTGLIDRHAPPAPAPTPVPTPTPAPIPTPTPAPPPPENNTLDFAQIPCPGDSTRSSGQLCIQVWIR